MKQIEKMKKIYLKYKAKDKKELIDKKFAYRRGKERQLNKKTFLLDRER
jgi:hypothetical protein